VLTYILVERVSFHWKTWSEPIHIDVAICLQLDSKLGGKYSVKAGRKIA